MSLIVRAQLAIYLNYLIKIQFVAILRNKTQLRRHLRKLSIKSLLASIKLEILKPITIFEDNNGCIAIANNPTDHKQSKHIDIKYHF